MKTNSRKMMFTVAAVFLALTAVSSKALALAASNIIISEVGAASNFFYFYASVAVPGCSGINNRLVQMDATAPNAKAMYATLLLAKAKNQPIYLDYYAVSGNCKINQVGINTP